MGIEQSAFSLHAAKRADRSDLCHRPVYECPNFGEFGHQIYDARQVFIEKSLYGWSHNATAAIALRNVGTAILDQLTCVDHADHIFADANTGELTVINSTYAQLDSFAHKTTDN